ncbi:MAG: DinB family protein, partial [Candidatus Saccharimonadales bacterium]
MDIIPMLLKEMEQEAQTTRKMLAIVPNDKYDWQPHPKSMTIKRLATHIAELPNWVTMAFTTDELDFATTTYKVEDINNTEDLLDYFERAYASGYASLANASEADLLPAWTLRNGEQIIQVMTKGGLVRVAFAQTVHHRAQLGVFLRLLDVPIPGSYG